MIKFRAYLKRQQGIVDVIEINYKYLEIKWENADYYLEVADFEDIDLLQSTGLVDINGTEIYENDIVSFKYPYDKRFKSTGVVIWNKDKASFGIKMNETTEIYDLYKVTSENYLVIIGNIYDSKELLLND